MKIEILVAIIAAGPPTVDAVLAFLAASRKVDRKLGPPDSPPLSALIAALEERIERRMDRLESKVDSLIDGHATITERLARLEGEATGRSGSAA